MKHSKEKSVTLHKKKKKTIKPGDVVQEVISIPPFTVDQSTWTSLEGTMTNIMSEVKNKNLQIEEFEKKVTSQLEEIKVMKDVFGMMNDE